MFAELPKPARRSMICLLIGLAVMTLALYVSKALAYVITLSVGGLFIALGALFFVLYFIGELRSGQGS